MRTNLFDRPFFTPIMVKKKFNKKLKGYKISPMGTIKQFMILNPNLLSDKSFDDNGNEIDFKQKKRAESSYAKKQFNKSIINIKLYK